jgi:hypothetical protein
LKKSWPQGWSEFARSSAKRRRTGEARDTATDLLKLAGGPNRGRSILRWLE